MVNVLIIGSGGREHSLAWKLKQSPKVEKIFIAPGNAGTSQIGENVPIPATDVGGLLQFAIKNNIDLTVVGPDDPLALGVVDIFRAKGLKIWGPTKIAAQMEWSKVFAKEIMRKADIPTAQYKTFSEYNQALEYVLSQAGHSPKEEGDGIDGNSQMSLSKPMVIKASGLALGKGVVICRSLEQAENTLRDFMINKIHGDSGSEVVIEEFLEGVEFSAHAISDGKTFKLFPCSQDHKRIFDGDEGPNTGGMGVVAPLPWVTEDDILEIKNHIVYRALTELKDEGAPFTGLLYPGLMKRSPPPSYDKRGSGGDIKVIEFNARFGDPECQTYMRLLKTDLLDVLMACVEGRLSEIDVEWHEGFACCVALASDGYPGKYEKGLPIAGIEEAEKMDDVIVFHAGTATKDGKLVTNGGRVLGVTAIGPTLKSALDKAYSAIKLIKFESMHYRTDIGRRTLSLINTKETE